MKVIGGTGRCGTRWLSGVLRWAGFAAGHEAAHTPEAVRMVPGIEVDVSWLAVVHGAPVDLLVAREPAGCIASLVDCGLFTDGDRYTQAVSRVVDLTGDPLADACRWWVHVNTLPAKARWRLDRPERLEGALHRAGINVDTLHLADLDPHPIGDRTTELGWDDLPHSVRKVAEEWGWR